MYLFIYSAVLCFLTTKLLSYYIYKAVCRMYTKSSLKHKIKMVYVTFITHNYLFINYNKLI